MICCSVCGGDLSGLYRWLCCPCGHLTWNDYESRFELVPPGRD